MRLSVRRTRSYLWSAATGATGTLGRKYPQLSLAFLCVVSCCSSSSSSQAACAAASLVEGEGALL